MNEIPRPSNEISSTPTPEEAGKFGYIAVGSSIETGESTGEFDPAAHLARVREVVCELGATSGMPWPGIYTVKRLTMNALDENSDTFDRLSENEKSLFDPRPGRPAAAGALTQNFANHVKRLVSVSWYISDSNSESRLSDEYMTAMAQELYDEWLTYHQIRQDAPPVYIRGIPLAYRSVHELEAASEQNLPIS